ncbi:hypothetical protein V6N11_025550 [Hibiscus sabdariffa]|uniref:Uncharacterized protein n=1 Tax=Hibiscus sabdariffa TaxID=183260 RepID=A0ABR2N8H1_9ROSI
MPSSEQWRMSRVWRQLVAVQEDVKVQQFMNVCQFVWILRNVLGGVLVDWLGGFYRSLRAFQVSLLDELRACVSRFRLRQGEEDRLVWKQDKVGIFSIRALYRLTSSVDCEATSEVAMVIPYTICDLMHHCFHGFFTTVMRSWWIVACAAVLWSLWIERNELLFQGRRLVST